MGGQANARRLVKGKIVLRTLKVGGIGCGGLLLLFIVLGMIGSATRGPVTPTAAPLAAPAVQPTATTAVVVVGQPATRAPAVLTPTAVPVKPTVRPPTATIAPSPVVVATVGQRAELTLSAQVPPTVAPTPTAVPARPTQAPPPTKPAATATPQGAFGSGTKVVPGDVKPGTYRSLGGSGCYWARLRGLGGSMAEIIANDNARGPTVVTIAESDKGFTSSRCAQWAPLGPPVTQSQTAPFGDGTYVVGLDVAPGTWRTDGQAGCYWARLSDLAGGMSSIITNDNGAGSAVVTIAPSDKGFQTMRCGMWTKAG